MQTLKVMSLIFTTSMFAAACGDSISSLNPTAPSALSADTLSVEAGAERGVSSAARPGNGSGGNGNGNRPANPGPPPNIGRPDNPGPPGNVTPGIPSPLPPGLSQVEIQGLISALTFDSVTVRGQVVFVTDASVIWFRDEPSSLSELNVGDYVHVRAGRTELSADARLEAMEIIVQRRATEDGDDEEDDPSN